MPSLLPGTLAACVGQAAAIELVAYLNNLSRMPDIDAIIEGREASVPQEVDLQYAVASALVSRAMRTRQAPDAQKVYGNILDYAGRFPLREMGVIAAVGRRERGILYTRQLA